MPIDALALSSGAQSITFNSGELSNKGIEFIRSGGGLAYTYPDGSKANHGVIIDGVFTDGTRNADVVQERPSNGSWRAIACVCRCRHPSYAHKQVTRHWPFLLHRGNKACSSVRLACLQVSIGRRQGIA